MGRRDVNHKKAILLYIAMEDILSQAFREIYPEKEFSYTPKITFSRRFSQYNASIVKKGSFLEIRASLAWKTVNKDIFRGLLQTLLAKLFGQPEGQTYAMDLYNRFLKNVHVSIPKTATDKELEASFHRVNSQFFSDLVELSNLKWGACSARKLGSYDFQTDTISISKMLCGKDNRLLDYVMFHEMLHKKLKFSHNKMKNYFHTAEFKSWEKKFPLHNEIEQELRRLGKKKTLVSWLNERFK